MEDAFHKVVEHIFNNWTALQLAVEHSMGGPNSKQVAVQSMNYIVSYGMSEQDLESEDFEDVLEDIMDREFDTLCEDNSIAEISQLLYKFLQMIKKGNVEEYNVEYAKLPVRPQWITNQAPAPKKREEVPAPSGESAVEESMDAEDSEWTQVKSKKKR
ncbi:PREDICTED: uncharacterized protein LOC108558223 [Nicrophorus vespilloides]|uniref:Pre-rRNA-processing protein TSR2 homolog n=1 Tax=Nicrophorus vespilloides TaxID=110193 RepID=A0ABM1M7J8_NICVS|nr:PREDICTED: uncharacterized protein LOC108558223 [Nicrophorus vespilloides]